MSEILAPEVTHEHQSLTREQLIDDGKPAANVRRGRPTGTRNAPKSEKRRYASELAALQNNIQVAGKLLRRAVMGDPMIPGGPNQLILAAMDVLGIDTN